jgi:outer membrane protein assembly factor BamB
MPHTTIAYPFEWKVGAAAAALSARCSSDFSLRSFLVILSADGNVTALDFNDGSPAWRDGVRAVERESVPHVFYDPIDDGMEYTWLSWQGIERNVMERLIGQRFEDADFIPMSVFAHRARTLEPPGQFPSSWGVMG